MNIKYYFFLAILLLLVSCKSNKEGLVYFKNINQQQSGTMGISEYDIKIVPDDELVITVNSVIPEATAAFNLPLANPSKQSAILTTAQPQIQTYIVDKNGCIQFPVLGEISVKGLTVSEIREKIKNLVSVHVSDPYIRVQLVNFKVNVIGEVKNPMTLRVTSDRISVIDAISAAGDITPYGLRSNVMVIREVDNQKIFQRLDLTDSNITSSPFFYLKQNDVVYVEPNKIRKDNAKYNQNNAFKLSVISTIVSACSVIASLAIALFINK